MPYPIYKTVTAVLFDQFGTRTYRFIDVNIYDVNSGLLELEISGNQNFTDILNKYPGWQIRFAIAENENFQTINNCLLYRSDGRILVSEVYKNGSLVTRDSVNFSTTLKITDSIMVRSEVPYTYLRYAPQSGAGEWVGAPTTNNRISEVYDYSDIVNLVDINIAPELPYLEKNSTVQFEVVYTYSDGSTSVGTSDDTTWEVTNNPDGIEIDSNGILTVPSNVTISEIEIKATNIIYNKSISTTGFFEIQLNNPYSPGGTTSGVTTPSSGNWTLPAGTAASQPNHSNMDSTQTGLFRTYAMDLTQINNFGSKLWSASVLDIIAKYFDDPLAVVMGCMEFPFPITNVAADTEITFSWIPSWANPLNVTGAKVNSEYVTIDFGSISIPRYSGTFYDFQPYTTAQIFLPYIGFVPVKFSELVGSQIHLVYFVSLTTGIACAQITSGKTRSIIGTYNCSVGKNLPLSSRNMMDLYVMAAKSAVLLAGAGVAGAAGSVSMGAAAGSLDTAISMENLAHYTESLGMSGAGFMKKSDLFLDAAVSQEEKGRKYYDVAKGRAMAAGQSALNGAMNANAAIERSGQMDALSGRCGPQNAFILVSVPHQNMPINYTEQIGFPSNVGGSLASFSGYLEVRSAFLNVPGATSDEVIEIERILKGGIYI